MSNLKSRDDYIFTEIPEGFVVNGNTLPGRSGDGVDRKEALRAEDIALLAEMVSERLFLLDDYKRSFSIGRAISKKQLLNIMSSVFYNSVSKDNPYFQVTGLTDKKAAQDAPQGYEGAANISGAATYETKDGSKTKWKGDRLTGTQPIRKNYFGENNNLEATRKYILANYSAGYMSDLKDIIDTLSGPDNIKLDRGFVNKCIDIVEKIKTAVRGSPYIVFKGHRTTSNSDETSDFSEGVVLFSCDSGRGESCVHAVDLGPSSPGYWDGLSVLDDCINIGDSISCPVAASFTRTTSYEREWKREEFSGDRETKYYSRTSYHGDTYSGKTYFEVEAVRTKGGEPVGLVKRITAFYNVGEETMKHKHDYTTTVKNYGIDTVEEGSYEVDIRFKSTVATIASSGSELVELKNSNAVEQILTCDAIGPFKISGNGGKKNKSDSDSSSEEGSNDTSEGCKDICSVTEYAESTDRSTAGVIGSTYVNMCSTRELEPHAKP